MLALLAVALLSQNAKPITIQTLLHEMGDREAFTRLPLVPYKQLQASSYDRTQTDPNDPKTWHGNHDYEQFIRTEQRNGKTEWVVMEHQGPGVITRIWTPLLADKNKMLVRFYFDGNSEPTIEEPFNDLVSGKSIFKPPFAFISWPDSAIQSGVGADLYYPIPFAKSCKVTLSELPFYYCFTYRAYSPGTTVETFSQSALGAASTVADHVASSVETSPDSQNSKRERYVSVRLAPGKEFSLLLGRGPSAINRMSLSIDRAHEPDLRATVLQMSFDGEQTVWCPIGEFFGCGIHDRKVWNRFVAYDEGGKMDCVWPMPFRRSARLQIRNLSSKTESFRVSEETEPYKWDSRSLHFHATWRYQYPLATRPMSDWNYLEAKGQGIYVGDTLTVFNPSPAWYGEGDERFYVDDEKFPSHLGTGTEDYYGYAWGMADHYSSAYLSAPMRDHSGRDNWTGYTTTTSVRALDAIPFDTSLKFDMEIWHWADCNVGYSAATFWYARPGATSNRQPDPRGAARSLPEAGGKIKGALECEDMKVLAKSDGVQVSTQTGALVKGTWSNNQQLFLQCKEVGDFVDLRMPVAKEGRYHVILYATKSYDYGVIRFMVNGKQGKEVDLWDPVPQAYGQIDLGDFDLKPGAAVLRAEVVGTNAKSTGAHYFFGLDCVVLKKI